MRVLALIAVLLTPLSASAVSFVYDGGPIGTFPDGGALAFPKAQNAAQPSIPNNKQFFSDDANAFWADLLDVRSAIVSGYYHGLISVSSAPPAPSSGFRIFNLNGSPKFEDSLGNIQSFLTDLDGGVQCPLRVADSLGHTEFSVDCGGNSSTGSLYVSGEVSFDAGLVVSGQLNVGLDAFIGGDVNISGNSVLTGELSAGNGAFTVDGFGNIATPAVQWTGTVSTQSSAVYETPSGFISATASPEIAFAYTTHCSAKVMRCTWAWTTGGSAATGNIVFSVIRLSDSHVYCTHTQTCNGKYDDGGVPDTYPNGYVDCAAVVVNGTTILAGTSNTCSARPGVNYNCQIACP